jgi:WD40 repeat protein
MGVFRSMMQRFVEPKLRLPLANDFKTGEQLLNVPVHESDMQVTDLQWAPDRTYFITASKDKTAKVRFLGAAATTLTDHTSRFSRLVPSKFSSHSRQTHL